MNYKEDSNWNDDNEIRCLIILKNLENENFPKGRQMELCEAMSKVTKLDKGNISAKVGNYKSVAGYNKPSNASKNTKIIYEKYKGSKIKDLEKLLH